MLTRVGFRAVASVPSVSRRFFSSDLSQPKKTALFDAHVELGGQMVEFAGYSLPVKYKDSLINSHKHVRENAGLFDVSHMGQLRIYGEQRLQFLETLCGADLLGMKSGESKLAVLLNEQGGALDDCIISTKEKHVFMVVNAGCKDKDIAHMKVELAKFNSEKKADVSMEYAQDRSLIALQGPLAQKTLAQLVPPSLNLSQMPFMTTTETTVNGLNCWVTRCGYTGEDGFEVSVPNSSAVNLWQKFLSLQGVLPSGLGVRDSLRIEAGLCLYGHELSGSISPIEAGLLWTIGKRRREEGGFLGASVIQKQIKEGTSKKLVGLVMKGAGAPAREGSQVVTGDDNKVIGNVTSGVPAPSMNMTKVAMAFVDSSFAKVGTSVNVATRGKNSVAEVVKMPFVPSKYHRVPK